MVDNNSEEEIEILDDNHITKEDIEKLTPRIDAGACVSGKEYKTEISLEDVNNVRKSNMSVEIESEDSLKTYCGLEYLMHLAIGVLLFEIVAAIKMEFALCAFIGYNIHACKKLSAKNKLISALLVIPSFIITPVLCFLFSYVFLFFLLLNLSIFGSSFILKSLLGLGLYVIIDIGLFPYVIYMIRGYITKDSDEEIFGKSIVNLCWGIFAIIFIIGLMISIFGFFFMDYFY